MDHEDNVAAEIRRQRRQFQCAPGFIAILRGPEHTFDFVNDAYVRLIGARDCIGHPARAVLPEIAGQELFEILDRVYASAERFNTEQTLVRLQRTPGGILEERYLDFIYEPILDSDGIVSGIFVEGFDVTARRDAELRLQELNATLAARVVERTRERDRVWANTRDLMVVIDAGGQFLAINPAWRCVLGHHPDEVVGRNFRDFIHPEDIPVTAHALTAAIAGEQLTGFENRYVHLNGTSRWISWRTSSEEGLMYAYGRDISAEKAGQRALQQSQARLRALFETRHLFQWFVSVEGILLEANAASLAAIAAARERVIGHVFADSPWFSATSEASQWAAQSVAAAAEGQAVHGEFEVDLPVSGRRRLDCVLRPVLNSRGIAGAVVAEALDLTGLSAPAS